MNINEEIKTELFKMQDIDYKKLHSKLIPTIEQERIIGVRTPVLRKFSNTIYKNKDIDIFLNSLPHFFYEENNLHAFCIEKEKDYNNCIDRINEFLPYVDNWATCDMMSPPIFAEHKNELIHQIKKWICSTDTYTVRFGLKCLMSHYLYKDFKTEYLKIAAEIKSDKYYIKMMIAWFFATALAKQYDETIPYIENKMLDVWTHNKTIRKSIESFRISKEQKDYLKTLKIKE